MAMERSKRFRMVQDGWFSGDTRVLHGDVPFARFSFGSWKPLGRISFEEGNYEVVRQGLGTLLRLELDGELVCETRIGGMWSQRAELSVDGIRYLVTWPAFDAKTILKRGKAEVGFVGKWRTWGREAEAIFLESVPPILCIFVMWLATNKRINDSA
jgi:hypothetical protein